MFKFTRDHNNPLKTYQVFRGFTYTATISQIGSHYFLSVTNPNFEVLFRDLVSLTYHDAIRETEIILRENGFIERA